MNKTSIFQIVIIVLLVVILGVIIYAGQQSGRQTKQNATSTDTAKQTMPDLSTTMELGKQELTVAFPPWPGATVKSQVVAEVLSGMGYTVETKQMDAGIVYTSLADKQVDINVAGWLPTTHQSYWQEKGDQLEIAGVNVTTTWLGLGVPAHVDESIQSITDLKNADAFGKSVDYNITGIEPGAGIMQNTETALAEYGLTEWNLQSSSAASMLTALQEAFEKKDPIIATVWQPHSSFAVGDLRKLKDPNGIYNDPEATRSFLEEHAPSYADAEVSSDVLASVVYQGFKQDAPAAYAFLENFTIPAETQSQWIYTFNVEEVKPETIATQYLRQNADTVQSWIPQE